jgi:hypothetical protein
MIGGILFDLTQGYRASFTLFACGYALAALVVLSASPPVPLRFGVDKPKRDL